MTEKNQTQKQEENTYLSKKRKKENENQKKEISMTLNDALNITEEEKLILLEEKEKENNYILNYLPMSHSYTKSYMHKDFIDHIISNPITDFIFTTSTDGILKFWKKKYIGIEYVKQFKSHPNKITGISISNDGLFLCTCSFKDEYLKIYDIINVDMINFIKLNFFPFLCEFISKSNLMNKICAVSEKEKGNIYIIDIKKNSIIKKLEMHHSQITNMKINWIYETIISTDNIGMIEYWSNKENYDLPDKYIKFSLKIETDLYNLSELKYPIISLTISPNGKLFSLFSNDNFYIFDFLTGKIKYEINENPKQYFQEKEIPEIEKEIRKYIENLPSPNIQFDESNNYIYYPTPIGIKLIELKSNKLITILGKKENDRFININLFQGKSLKNNSGIIGQGGKSSQGEKVIDPILFAISYKKIRFFLFSKNDIKEDEKLKRDIINEKIIEKPNKNIINQNIKNPNIKLPKQAILETSFGEIHIKLYSDLCPKTVENFIKLSKKGYYDNLIFHRVIKNFMIQTGDPKGNGTGGESIWGGTFEDEFNDLLTHDSFTVSMANFGPNTNGSQFFITTVPCKWLDGKHTVFGKVFRGMENVQSIENVKCDKNDKPYNDVKLYKVRIIN